MNAIGEWVESLALQFVRVGGLPLIAGRIVGWLMVCEPAQQSAEQIASGIGASRASMSTNLRLLESAGMITATTRRGDRVRYYHIDERAWETAVRMQIAGLGAFIRIADEGVALVGDSSDRARRIKAARRVFQWMVDIFDKAPPLEPQDD
jgi:DNA-binding transcriptional ArsR family regulator